ncbi:MAG: hypothetical protein JWO91_1916, partial [Acidobacteriaceae bacterium]|nr:hypothetical protein [Acidobacteriaceae bacterium]
MRRVAHCWLTRVLLYGFVAAFCVLPVFAHRSSRSLAAQNYFASYQ